jgi:hypothetical protein
MLIVWVPHTVIKIVLLKTYYLKTVLVGKPEGKRQLGRPRHRWKDDIKMDLQEVGCECMYWIDLAQDRDRWLTLVNVVMNLQVT